MTKLLRSSTFILCATLSNLAYGEISEPFVLKIKKDDQVSSLFVNYPSSKFPSRATKAFTDGLLKEVKNLLISQQDTSWRGIKSQISKNDDPASALRTTFGEFSYEWKYISRTFKKLSVRSKSLADCTIPFSALDSLFSSGIFAWITRNRLLSLILAEVSGSISNTSGQDLMHLLNYRARKLNYSVMYFEKTYDSISFEAVKDHDIKELLGLLASFKTSDKEFLDEFEKLGLLTSLNRSRTGDEVEAYEQKRRWLNQIEFLHEKEGVAVALGLGHIVEFGGIGNLLFELRLRGFEILNGEGWTSDSSCSKILSARKIKTAGAGLQRMSRRENLLRLRGIDSEDGLY